MLIKNLLPIGSVVRLKEDSQRYAIIGILQTKSLVSRKEYDYVGVPYPEGFSGRMFRRLFDGEDISEVCFRGLADEEWTEYLEELEDVYADTSRAS